MCNAKSADDIDHCKDYSQKTENCSQRVELVSGRQNGANDGDTGDGV
jgi:hypothetical protein